MLQRIKQTPWNGRPGGGDAHFILYQTWRLRRRRTGTGGLRGVQFKQKQLEKQEEEWQWNYKSTTSRIRRAPMERGRKKVRIHERRLNEGEMRG